MATTPKRLTEKEIANLAAWADVYRDEYEAETGVLARGIFTLLAERDALLAQMQDLQAQLNTWQERAISARNAYDEQFHRVRQAYESLDMRRVERILREGKNA